MSSTAKKRKRSAVDSSTATLVPPRQKNPKAIEILPVPLSAVAARKLALVKQQQHDQHTLPESTKEAAQPASTGPPSSSTSSIVRDVQDQASSSNSDSDNDNDSVDNFMSSLPSTSNSTSTFKAARLPIQKNAERRYYDIPSSVPASPAAASTTTTTTPTTQEEHEDAHTLSAFDRSISGENDDEQDQSQPESSAVAAAAANRRVAAGGRSARSTTGRRKKRSSDNHRGCVQRPSIRNQAEGVGKSLEKRFTHSRQQILRPIVHLVVETEQRQQLAGFNECIGQQPNLDRNAAWRGVLFFSPRSNKAELTGPSLTDDRH